MWWYHATITDRKEIILQQGLIPKAESPDRDFPPRIYLSKSIELCLQYAEVFNERAKDKIAGYSERSFSLLTIWLPDKIEKELLPDPETGHDGFYLEGIKIPSSNIEFSWDIQC